MSPWPDVTLRLRDDADAGPLVDVLTSQQTGTRYPFRWPLPMAVRDFVIRASDEAAWVAERDGTVVGHVAVGTLADEDAAPFTSALSTTVDELRAVTTLFVDPSARGTGVGRQLLATAEADIVSRSLVPVLEVLPVHAAALALYESRGWRTIATDRPAWLPAEAPDVRYLALRPGETRAGDPGLQPHNDSNRLAGETETETMTAQDEHTFYADPTNHVPQGAPRRRRGQGSAISMEQRAWKGEQV